MPRAAETAPSAAPSAASSGPLLGVTPEGPREWTHGEDINWGRQVANTLVWLALMSGAIWLIVRFMSGRAGLGGMGFGGRRSIQVLERQVLGPQKAILTVRVHGKILLLGMTDHTITTLAELDPEAPEPLANPLPPVTSPRPQERPAASEPPPDNLVDLASLFGRRGSQSSRGDDPE